jgi:hypothetical protein
MATDTPCVLIQRRSLSRAGQMTVPDFPKRLAPGQSDTNKKDLIQKGKDKPHDAGTSEQNVQSKRMPV